MLMASTLISRERLNSFLGKNIHVSKLKYGCVFKLIAITEDSDGQEWMHLETPSTRKPYKFKVEYAQYLRKDIPNENNL